MSKCARPTQDGTPCQRQVSTEGNACWQHQEAKHVLGATIGGGVGAGIGAFIGGPLGAVIGSAIASYVGHYVEGKLNE